MRTRRNDRIRKPFIFRPKSSSSVFMGERPQLLRKVAVAAEWDAGWVPKKGARPCPERKSAQIVRPAR